MNMITIPNTSLQISKFIFGTGRIVNIYNKSKRQKLLKFALECGFSHFDTAPYYGFGNSEKDIGDLAENKKFTVTTKVGLYPKGGADQNMLNVFLRKSVGKIFKNISKPEIDFSLNKAKNSLNQSLRRLKRDTIDIYALHEGNYELIKLDEWIRWIEDIKKNGKIRYFAISSNLKNFKTFLKDDSYKVFDIIQLEDSLERREADIIKDYKLKLQITYGYLSSRKKTERNKKDIKEIIKRNSSGAIIVSSRNFKNIQKFSSF